MPARETSAPVKVVGSSVFARYAKINDERTYNMFISDDWLVNYPGYRRVLSEIDGDEGRGLFHSVRGKLLIAVIDAQVYRIEEGLGVRRIGEINTRFGDVIIDENLASQICIVDGNDAWIYNYDTDDFTLQTLTVNGFDVIPGYVTYHNTFFLIAPSINDPNNTNEWYAFQRATDSTIALVPNSVFPLQTKADNCLAVVRLPGKGNNVLVIGSIVCEVWTQIGGEDNYRRNSAFNIDSGALSLSTIASNDRFVTMLAQNQNNTPVLMVTDGASVQYISTDGIDFLLQSVNFPQDSTGFFYRQDGHLFYQITFFNKADNLSLVYDFNTQKFFNVSDDDLNFHPARDVVFFGGQSLFISLVRGSIYELSTDIIDAIEVPNTLVGRTIPRIRITNTIRVPNTSRFYCSKFTFWLEQGTSDVSDLDVSSTVCEGEMLYESGLDFMIYESGDTMLFEGGSCNDVLIERPAVDLAVSKNGNESFSNFVRRDLNTQGNYKNEIRWHRIGFANELTFQIRFWGRQRFVANDGLAIVRQ